MKKIQSLRDLQRFRDQVIKEKRHKTSPGKIELVIGTGSCGIAAGALDVLHAIENQIKELHLKNIVISQTVCIGLCEHEPILEVIVGDTPKVAYGNVDPDMVKRIMREHVIEGKVVEEFIIDATPFPTI
jgi:NADP-reducing hydrogenase subunit HndB